MAYKINNLPDYIDIPDGVATGKDIVNTYKLALQDAPEFYELEPAEVLSVILDEDDFSSDDEPSTLLEDSTPNWSFYGAIRARMAMSGGVRIIRPLDSNIKEYPMPGEYVIVADYFGDLYYTQKLNIRNSVNSNFKPGLSKIHNPTIEEYPSTDFESDLDISQVKAYHGDITFNGRFGQSIRFGSNITEITGSDSYPKSGPLDKEGLQSSPNIIIKAGQGIIPNNVNQPVLEDINLDGSSIWMTTNQIVDFTESSTEAHKDTKPKKYDGNQIIVNSDRIVFNSKVNSIHAFSKVDISMAADLRINIEAPIVSLGSESARQPAICGDIMMDKFKALCKALQIFSGQLSNLLPLFGNVGIPLPMLEVKAAGIGLQKSIEFLMTEEELDKPKSKVVYVEKAYGR